ncbi:hypothetical protein OG994_04060 [Micromonospora globbae]|uniref:Uncharacterized protein n=1 Tax=Micromonospora globbae TaxID=1894969 RepID=A0ABZ1SA41_9ACTN|nr:hypothetical protein [Micromonospora globbae]
MFGLFRKPPIPDADYGQADLELRGGVLGSGSALRRTAISRTPEPSAVLALGRQQN